MVSGGESSLTNLSKKVVPVVVGQQRQIIENEKAHVKNTTNVKDLMQHASINSISNFLTGTTIEAKVAYPFTFTDKSFNDLVLIESVQTAIDTYNSALPTYVDNKYYKTINNDLKLKDLYKIASELGDTFDIFLAPFYNPQLKEYFEDDFEFIGKLLRKSDSESTLKIKITRNPSKDHEFFQKFPEYMVPVMLEIITDIYNYFVLTYGENAASQFNNDLKLNNVIGQMLLKKGLEIMSKIESDTELTVGMQSYDLTIPFEFFMFRNLANDFISASMIHLGPQKYGSESFLWNLSWEDQIVYTYNNPSDPMNTVPFGIHLKSVKTVKNKYEFVSEELNSVNNKYNMALASQRTNIDAEELTIQYKFLDSEKNEIEFDLSNAVDEVYYINITIKNTQDDIVLSCDLLEGSRAAVDKMPPQFSFVSQYYDNPQIYLQNLDDSRSIKLSHPATYKSFLDAKQKILNPDFDNIMSHSDN